MKKIHSLAIALLVTLTGLAQTGTLCNFDFNGSSGLPVSAVSTASNITASINGTTSNAAYDGTTTGSGAFVQNTTAGTALSMSNSGGNNTAYWTLTLGGSALNSYQAFRLYFQSEHSSTGATAITLSYSTDGNTYTALSQTVAPGLNTSFTEATVDLSTINALNAATTIYIRFAAGGASGTGTLRMDNLQVQGTISPWQNNGNSTTFNGAVTAPTLTITGDARILGNLTAAGLIASSTALSITTPVIFSNTIKNTSLAGTGSRILLTDAIGNISPLSAGTASQVLFGNGTWAALPAQTFTSSGSNAYFTGGNLGIGNSNPTVPLDVAGDARIAGNLTANGLSASSSNLSVSTPATFGNAITITSLAGNSGLNEVYVDSTGNLKINPIIPANSNYPPITAVVPCKTGNPAWLTGGNTLNAITNAVLGTCDNHDLVFEANSNQAIWLKPSGNVGIATSYPGALLHISTYNSTTTPGLIIDQGNPDIEGPPEFIVGNDGSTAIYNLGIPGTNDPFSVYLQNTRQGPTQTSVSNVFRVAPNGNVGIGNNTYYTYGVDAPVSVSAYKALTVSGDVSLANYNSSQHGNQADGMSALEILGNSGVPTRRGISLDPDPNGDFNFYINSDQPNSQFNFINGLHGAISSTNPALLTIGSDGSITSNALALSTATTNRNLSVDPTGKIIAGAAAGTAWALGGNGTNVSVVPGSIGTTDNTDVPFITANTERMRITAAGNIAITQGNQLLVKGTDANHGLGYFDATTGFGGTAVDGPVLYGYTGGALGTNQNGTQHAALNWNSAGTTTISVNTAGDAFLINDLSSGTLVNNFKVKSTGQVYARELIVKYAGIAFPDYVFDKAYKLTPLEEVKKYIDSNHHLPNMPTAKEVEKEGANVGEIQRISVEKIEELTLYMIEMKKEMDKQNKEIEKLKQENKALKVLINK